MKRKISK